MILGQIITKMTEIYTENNIRWHVFSNP